MPDLYHFKSVKECGLYDKELLAEDFTDQTKTRTVKYATLEKSNTKPIEAAEIAEISFC